ncbi:MAG: PAS domain-containing sensor histidine kinase [Lyngbya sp. HA4199-MV5]|jgi:PAS domain S-box-containing protein|nr:PAS domain-containing sensor histidine kinase [Lyngbya sp. HA4199-MV5]
MNNIEAMGSKLHNAQHRVEVLSRHAEEFLTQPTLLSTVLEELAVVLEEVEQQYEEVLVTRQTLEQQRQRYQELFDFAPDGYLVTDEQGVIREANQSAASLFGMMQTFLVNKPLSILVAEADRRAFLTYFSRLEAAPPQRNWDFRFKSRQGGEFPVVITTSAMRSAQGTLTGWRWLVRDITELKQACANQSASATQAGVDDLRATFVQVVSHELRTPMTTILIALELLVRYSAAKGEIDTRQQTYFDRIHQAIWRMNALINDVLLYAEAESDPAAFNPAPMNLEALCAERLQKQRDHDHDHHAITINSSGACDAACVDSVLVQQMLDRLLSNAVTYSPEGTTVRVMLHCEHDRICFSVHNAGTYIPPEQQAKLFEPFYRLENTVHTAGIGLGLAFVKQAVDQHGGDLSVESSVETGTTFKVSLPTGERSSQG